MTHDTPWIEIATLAFIFDWFRERERDTERERERERERVRQTERQRDDLLIVIPKEAVPVSSYVSVTTTTQSTDDGLVMSSTS